LAGVFTCTKTLAKQHAFIFLVVVASAPTMVVASALPAGGGALVKLKSAVVNKTRGATSVVAKLWSQAEENKEDKFCRNLQHVPEETVYKVALDLWLTVERYGEPAIRVALETMLDRDTR
ncbi:unnamed protein product, partial [Amoebophrya sp. A25]